jgi:CheY-like chemotaxis protein
MSLNYKILWIEDNPTTIKSKKGQIEIFLKEQGFRPEIVVIESGETIEEYLSDPLLDLIITDYKIKDDLNGKQLTEKIRGLDAMVDIILYSQVAGTDLYKQVGALDGVYISNREDLEDKIKDVIKITIRRTQNVSNMRGIVISEGIDIENQIEEIIMSYFQDEKDLAQKILNMRNTCDFGKKIAFLHSILNKMNKYLNKIIADSSLSSAIRGECKQYVSEFTPLGNICKKLPKEVMEPRNILAHVEYVINQDNKPFLKSLEKGYEAIVIDSQWCKDKRVALNEHRQNLEKVKDFIKVWNVFRANKIPKTYVV